VSVIVANFNGAGQIEAALQAIQRQTLKSLEILVVDDASTDDSVDRVERMAKTDSRIRSLALSSNGGPAAARNSGLDAATGEWTAIVDADDLIHPQRLEQLLQTAEADGADMIADDLLQFHDDQPRANHRFLRGRRADGPTWIPLDNYLDETLLLRSPANLGYLKPVIRTSAWRTSGVRYDERLRIGEDDDLICRLLAAGLRYRLVPNLSYFYRRHASSTSHRLSLAAVTRMADQEAGFRLGLERSGGKVPAALDRRRDAIADAAGFVQLIEALKRRAPVAALCIALRRPGAAALLRIPLRDRLVRLVSLSGAAPGTSDGDGRNLCVISRQRLIGRVNGSSTYLLDLVEHLGRRGWRVHLLQPSPVVMGRWPVMRLKADMEIFASVRVRGTWRIGDLLLARNPAVYLNAVRAVVLQVLRRAGLAGLVPPDQPAPYAVAAPYTDDDRMYVARQAPAISDQLLLDYMFQMEAVPFALRPDAGTAIVMHDLFHARLGQFEAVNGKDSVAAVTAAEEIALLGRADAVLAIQSREASWVTEHVPGVRVLEVPHPARPVPEPSAGEDDLVLFVGSNTAPNVIALEWFLGDAWPKIVAHRPAATLLVAGSVARGVTTSAGSVQMLGVVDDLSALYRRAGVVVSPLTTGSGLKIKLIEALSQGKAIVATSVTLQGVEAIVGPAVALADEAPIFADHVIRLLGDPVARLALATRALDTARARFNDEDCYGPVAAWFAQHRTS
jgi:succinoglycan biosynthesis protein ExoO